MLFLVRSSTPYMSNRIDVDFIIKRLVEENYLVDIYDIKQKILLNCNTDSKIKIAKTFKFLEFSKLYLIVNFYVFFKFLRKNRGKYDLCHIFYVREEQLLLASLIKKIAPKMVVTIYGSDLNIKNRIKNNFKNLYKYATKITATNQGILSKLIYENKEMSLKEKTEVLMFPQVRFNAYNNFDLDDKNYYKKKLGYDVSKKVVVVGTSAASYECHSEIISELSKMEKENVLFVFPLTYGSGNYLDYRNIIKKEIEEKIKNNDFVILFDYMDEEMLSTLRKASDVLINLRENDQLVASMLESFLTGCEVIAGSWLPYQILDDLNISLFKVSKRNLLNLKLKEVLLLNPTNRREQLLENRKAVLKEYDVTNDLNKWSRFYKSLIK